MESTFVEISVEGRKTVQDCWFGRGNSWLNKVSKQSSEVQCQFGSLPNDRDGMSVIRFRSPGICNGVRGDNCFNLSQSANARKSWEATLDPLAAIQRTQCTVGELSLKSATCAPGWKLHTFSMTSHNNSSPAISRSEFVMDPVGFVAETRACLMSSGHSRRNTVGVHGHPSPMTIPHTPCLGASLTPT